MVWLKKFVKTFAGICCIETNIMQEEYQLMIPRSGSVSDLLEALQKKANISDEVFKNVHVYEAHNNKFYKDLPADYQIMGIGDYFTLYAAPFPEEPFDKKITVFHFDREPAKVHGIPFIFPLKEVRISLFLPKIYTLTFFRVNLSVKQRSVCLTLSRSKVSLSTRSSLPWSASRNTQDRNMLTMVCTYVLLC
jgi:hypothetical protein